MDALRDKGWVECGFQQCNGSGIAAHFCEETLEQCTDGEHPKCSHCGGLGLVPPAWVETVGDLQELLATADPAAPVRFHDPDTGWMMRFRAYLKDPVKDWGEERAGWVLIDTEDYSDRA